jgi:hypothetical protein
MTTFNFYIASYVPKIQRTKEESIGPCMKSSCDGVVDLSVTAHTFCLFSMTVWTSSTEEVIYCPKCEFSMSPQVYEETCSPLMEAQAPARTCHKCSKPVDEEWRCCPYCSQTFLSMV